MFIIIKLWTNIMIWWITAISWKYVHALKFLWQYLSWGRYLLTTVFMWDWSSEVGEYLGPTVTVWTHQVSSNPSMRYKTLQEKWLFHQLSDGKLDAPGLQNWVRHNDPSSMLSLPTPPARNKRREAGARHHCTWCSIEPELWCEF